VIISGRKLRPQVNKPLNQNKMKVTIEFDNEQEAIQALTTRAWYDVAWSLDQVLRGIVKYGYIENRKATEREMEVYEKCREMLREAMSENNLTFNL
jgi:hypothetical protein